jgi:amino acid transporter
MSYSLTGLSEAPDTQLLRAIGTRRLTASIVNVLIGAGIFVLPAVVGASLGRAAPLAYLLCAGLMGLVVACFAAAGSRVSLTGGLYAYIEVAFGPFIGFLAGVLYLCTAAFAVASVASALADSVLIVLPPLGAPAMLRAAIILAAFLLLAVVNTRGVTIGAGLIELTTLAKLLPLVTVIAAGSVTMTADRVAIHDWPSASTLGASAIVLIFAFQGIEVALVPSGEVRNPARTIPRALAAGLATTTAIYLAIQLVAESVLGPDLGTFSAAPLAEAAGRLLGPRGRLFVLAGAVVSMFGYLSGDVLGSPRSLFALGRDGILPRAFAAVHPRFRTPHVAIAFYAVSVAALAISSSFARLAILASVTTLTLYLACSLAAWELQRRDVRMAEAGGAPFVLPAGPLIPLLAATAILWLLSHATRREFGILALVVGVASAAYFARKTSSTPP